MSCKSVKVHLPSPWSCYCWAIVRCTASTLAWFPIYTLDNYSVSTWLLQEHMHHHSILWPRGTLYGGRVDCISESAIAIVMWIIPTGACCNTNRVINLPSDKDTKRQMLKFWVTLKKLNSYKAECKNSGLWSIRKSLNSEQFIKKNPNNKSFCSGSTQMWPLTASFNIQ